MEKASIPWLALPDSRPGLVPPFVSMHWLGPVTKRNSAECRLDQTARLTMDACRLPLGRLEAGSAWILLASQSGGFFSVLFLSSTEFAPSLLRASPPEYLVILGAPHRVGKRTTIAVPRSRGLVGGCSGERLRRWEGPGAAGAGSRCWHAAAAWCLGPHQRAHGRSVCCRLPGSGGYCGHPAAHHPPPQHLARVVVPESGHGQCPRHAVALAVASVALRCNGEGELDREGLLMPGQSSRPFGLSGAGQGL